MTSTCEGVKSELHEDTCKYVTDLGGVSQGGQLLRGATIYSIQRPWVITLDHPAEKTEQWKGACFPDCPKDVQGLGLGKRRWELSFSVGVQTESVSVGKQIQFQLGCKQIRHGRSP